MPVNIMIVLSDETLEKVRLCEIEELKFAVIPVTKMEEGISLLKFVDEETGQRVAVTIEPRRAIKVNIFDRAGNLVSSYKGISATEDPVA